MGARWAATGPAWFITRPGSRSPKARSGLIWQALLVKTPVPLFPESAQGGIAGTVLSIVC